MYCYKWRFYFMTVDSMILDSEFNLSFNYEFDKLDHLDDLSEDVKLYILSFINILDLNNSVKLINKEWAVLSKNNLLWKTHTKNKYPDSYKEYLQKNIKEICEPNFQDLYKRTTLFWNRMCCGNTLDHETFAWQTEEKSYFYNIYKKAASLFSRNEDSDLLTPLLFSENKMIGGCADGAIRIWDLNNKKLLKILSGGHTDCIKKILLQGNRIITGSIDSSIGVWNLETGELIRKLEDERNQEIKKDKVRGIHVYGETLISFNNDSSIKIWDLETGKKIETLQIPGQKTYNYSSDIADDRLVVTNANRIYVWNLKTRECLHELKSHTNPNADITAVKIVGEYVISSSYDKTLQVCNINTGKHVASLTHHKGDVMGFAVYNDKIVSTSLDHTMRIWNLKNFQTSIQLKGGQHAGAPCFKIFDNRILCPSSDHTMQVWDIETGESLLKVEKMQVDSEDTDEQFISQPEFVEIKNHQVIVSKRPNIYSYK